MKLFNHKALFFLTTLLCLSKQKDNMGDSSLGRASSPPGLAETRWKAPIFG